MNNVLNIFDTVSAANKGAEMYLLHPVTKLRTYADAEETKPLIINLLGVDSEAFEKHALKMQRKKSRENAQQIKTGKVPVETPESIEQAKRDSCDLYAKMTTGWKNIPDASGKGELEFNYQNAFALYMTYKDIRVQVGNGIGDQSLFIVD